MITPSNPSTTPSPDQWSGLRRDAQGRALCSARKRGSQDLCNSPAMTGQTKCRMHGGASPQARNKARLRLMELVDPAVAQLARIMTTADKDSDKLRAVENILDRAGYGRSATVEVDDKRAMILEQIAEIQSKRDLEIEDAEIIDDTDPTTEETP